MLGITVADAVAVGTLIIALLAAWRGTRAGDAAKRISPPETTLSVGMAAFADTSAMTKMTEAIDRLAEAICDASEARERVQASHLAEAIRRMTEALDTQDRERGRHR
jgi:predicted ATP-grasp superfamily ATP-dependent carboligase